MPAFDSSSDALGGIDDRVRLRLANADVVIFDNYEVHTGILKNPCAWALRLGWGDVARDLIKKYPPRTPFQLYIGPALQMTGTVDAINVTQDGGATNLTLKGRDSCAALMRGYVLAEKTLADTTYKDLVLFALKAVGFNVVKTPEDVKDPTVDKLLYADNVANRQAKAGIPIGELAPIGTVRQILDHTQPGAPAGSVFVGATRGAVQAKLGEKWLEFLRRHLDRAGLFLWGAYDGNFVLSAPNIHQPPLYRILRQRGLTRNAVTVEKVSFENDTTHRPAEIAIFGKAGGKRAGRGTMRGDFKDAEMQALGFRDALVVRDAQTKSPSAALFLARRKLAEAARAGYKLEYVVTGHTVGALGTFSGRRAVWTADTLVDVQDDELGIKDVFYISDVDYRRGSDGTTSTLRLMRLQDMIFGEVADDRH